MTSRALPRLILASGSPRRRDILQGLGLQFAIRPVGIDESALPGEPPDRHVLRLAALKAATAVRPGELALAADTVVVIDGDILGKPADSADARAMLARLAGRRHGVFSGVALHHHSGSRAVDVDYTEVEIAAMTESEIEWYVETREPLDKAGSYAIQGLGALFVKAVFGNYSNVVGLPLPLAQALFRSLGYELRRFRAD